MPFVEIRPGVKKWIGEHYENRPSFLERASLITGSGTKNPAVVSRNGRPLTPAEIEMKIPKNANGLTDTDLRDNLFPQPAGRGKVVIYPPESQEVRDLYEQSKSKPKGGKAGKKRKK